ncbi:DUF6338 family protein [Glycomyces sp. YM15]|uniref:DUF6338 family protein n=1 Tax=Glycomyces sp. YM15 TaxID=2800446 RepID=UPI001966C9A0|nr:DUF6338 family protein [Glycomyces sp. YM15]
MPTTITSLILFMTLVIPGVLYVSRRERGLPERQRSVFRETIGVGVAGITFNLLALIPILILAMLFPSVIVDVSKLIIDTRKYLGDNWYKAGLWACVTLVLATGLAWLSSRKPKEPTDDYTSSWAILFKKWRHDREVHIGCTLDDGSWFGGMLASYNTSTVESGDRDIILSQPLEYRDSTATEAEPYPQVSAVCLSARHIRSMSITWLPVVSVSRPEKGSAQKQGAEAASADSLAEERVL